LSPRGGGHRGRKRSRVSPSASVGSKRDNSAGGDHRTNSRHVQVHGGRGASARTRGSRSASQSAGRNVGDGRSSNDGGRSRTSKKSADPQREASSTNKHKDAPSRGGESHDPSPRGRPGDVASAFTVDDGRGGGDENQRGRRSRKALDIAITHNGKSRHVNIVGAPKRTSLNVALLVSGCSDATIRDTIQGKYVPHGLNAGKLVYKKVVQSQGLGVLIYYWDGADDRGWWFGTEVGGDMCWAYHPSQAADSPPAAEWNVPHDAPIDRGFKISPVPL